MFPKNCKECPYGKTYHRAYYGSRGCKFEKQIIKAVLENNPIKATFHK